MRGAGGVVAGLSARPDRPVGCGRADGRGGARPLRLVCGRRSGGRPTSSSRRCCPTTSTHWRIASRRLQQWSDGFLTAFEEAAGEVEGDAADALEDIVRIADVGGDLEDDDDNEFDFFSVVEHLKVAVLLIHDATHASDAEEARSRTTMSLSEYQRRRAAADETDGARFDRGVAGVARPDPQSRYRTPLSPEQRLLLPVRLR